MDVKQAVVKCAKRKLKVDVKQVARKHVKGKYCGRETSGDKKCKGKRNVDVKK